jgi:hypothetical protein
VHQAVGGPAAQGAAQGNRAPVLIQNQQAKEPFEANIREIGFVPESGRVQIFRMAVSFAVVAGDETLYSMQGPAAMQRFFERSRHATRRINADDHYDSEFSQK